jgi:uncharacterized membrane protein HdeD (DUF308 family)
MTEYPVHGGHADASAGRGVAPTTVEEPVGVPFWQVIVLGIATLLFGIVVLAWPAETLRTLGVLVGIWLLVAGASRIFGAFSSQRGTGRQVLSGTVGVILLIGGVACLRNVAKGVLVLAFMIALAWILGGLTEFVIALQVTGATRTWLIVLAIISIAIGFVFMLWPSLSLQATVLLTGISALIIGAGEIAFAFQMRRLAATPVASD